MINGQLLEQAKEVLDGNWTGDYTKPAPDLYPHQWNWDSGFIAIGYSHYSQEKAQQELWSLFRGQWKNGMVPHMVFNPDAIDQYFPEPDLWQIIRSPHAPKDVQTSGITMPPVHATAALQIYMNADDGEKALHFLQEIFPKIYASHRYFYLYRDPLQEGLVYICHPWESGTDNSPTWDPILKRINVESADIPAYRRKDVDTVPANQRPSDDDYDRYIYLVDVFRQNSYDEITIREKCPFLVQDPMFNSLLAKANEDLIEIAGILNQDTKEIEDWHDQTKKAMNNKLWNTGSSNYLAYDLVKDEPIPMQALSGFIPLFAGIPSSTQAQSLVERLNSPGFSGPPGDNVFMFPSYDMQAREFDAHNYWRGPVWVNMSWMLYHGLKRYGFTEKADALREDILSMVNRFGLYEYFSPYKNLSKGEAGGKGANQFSWTAALCIDMLYENSHLAVNDLADD